jgi:hypothetical protein
LDPYVLVPGGERSLSRSSRIACTLGAMEGSKKRRSTVSPMSSAPQTAMKIRIPIDGERRTILTVLSRRALRGRMESRTDRSMKKMNSP